MSIRGEKGTGKGHRRDLSRAKGIVPFVVEAGALLASLRAAEADPRRSMPGRALSPEFIAGNEVYVAEEGGEAQGCYGLVAGTPNCTLEHFWVRPAAMGRGVGRRLFEHARDVAAATGASVLEIDADPNAEAFYLKMGAVRVGEVRSEVDGQTRVRPLLRLRLS